MLGLAFAAHSRFVLVIPGKACGKPFFLVAPLFPHVQIAASLYVSLLERCAPVLVAHRQASESACLSLRDEPNSSTTGRPSPRLCLLSLPPPPSPFSSLVTATTPSRPVVAHISLRHRHRCNLPSRLAPFVVVDSTCTVASSLTRYKPSVIRDFSFGLSAPPTLSACCEASLRDPFPVRHGGLPPSLPPRLGSQSLAA